MWVNSNELPGRKSILAHVRYGVAGVLSVLAVLVANSAQAFPALNLMPGIPDIESSFITVDYVGNNTAGTLTASGFANVITPPGSPQGNITAGTFDINSNIAFNSLTASGTLSIGGSNALLGLAGPTLLTGVFDTTTGTGAFGAGPGDPLEFLFEITGGDAAPIFGGAGSQAGVILSQSGYSGSFAGNFTSGAFQGLADTFGPAAVPEPATIALVGGGLLLLGSWRRRRVRIA